MLFENKTKERIKEKFYNKSIFNNSHNTEILNNIYNGMTGGSKRKNKVSNKESEKYEDIDDMYNDTKHDSEEDLNLPVDDEISTFLPDINALIKYDYSVRDIDYEMKLELLKGYPKERKHIKFVIFTINTNSTLPFLLFLFYKDGERFIIPALKKDPIEKDNNYTTKNISDIVISNLFSNIIEKPLYRGYKTYSDEDYLFFEYIPTLPLTSETVSKFEEESENNDSKERGNTIRAERFNRSDKLIWATISEIIDDRKILNFDIEPKSYDFFINHLDVISLYKDGGVLKHETPIIGYYGGYHKTTNYTAVFGVSKSSNYDSLGPFYYFASYENAMRYAIFSATNRPVKIDGEFITIDENGRFDKGGMVRFAVFVGKMKLYDDNGKHNTIDQINIKKEHVTSWVDDYNSAFVGLYELNDNGKKIYNHAKYVVKQYGQQIPLTYHYVNTDVNIVAGNYSKIFIE